MNFEKLKQIQQKDVFLNEQKSGEIFIVSSDRKRNRKDKAGKNKHINNYKLNINLSKSKPETPLLIKNHEIPKRPPLIPILNSHDVSKEKIKSELKSAIIDKERTLFGSKTPGAFDSNPNFITKPASSILIALRNAKKKTKTISVLNQKFGTPIHNIPQSPNFKSRPDSTAKDAISPKSGTKSGQGSLSPNKSGATTPNIQKGSNHLLKKYMWKGSHGYIRD